MPDPRAPGADRRAAVVLAFDTAASACSVAVGRGDAVLAYERRDMRHGHAESLLPMIDRAMAAAGLAPGAIDIVAVSVGPGGFTGIRAGLAAAQGLTLAARARLVGISSFAAVMALVPRGDANVLVALDSRREDLYVQIFMASGDPYAAPAAVLPAELDRFVAAAIGDGPLRVAGDATGAAVGALGDRKAVDCVTGSAPDALGVLAAAHMRRDATETTARPLYLRAPDVSFPKARRIIGGAA